MKQFETMLAKKFEAKKLTDVTFAQPKLDGVRCYITKDGAFSRRHKRFYSINHILEQLAPVFEENPDYIFDGELYNHDFKDNFNKIISLVRTEKSTDEGKVAIQYHCYDLLKDIDDPDKFEDRHQLINKVIEEYNLPNVRGVKCFHISEDSIKDSHKLFLEEGYEGTILRANEQYHQKRTWALMKVKDFVDDEATISSVVEGLGKLQGCVGKFVMVDSTGRYFGCPPGGFSHEERREMWKNKDSFVGQEATFEHFGLTVGGKSYRHPMFKGLRNYE